MMLLLLLLIFGGCIINNNNRNVVQLLFFIYLLLFTINNNYFLRGEDDGICRAWAKAPQVSRIRIVSEMDKVYEDMENMTLDNGVMRRKNMKVIVHCNLGHRHKPAKYEIVVGRGKQNFRWLGLVAAGRYKNECRLMSFRQREVDALGPGARMSPLSVVSNILLNISKHQLVTHYTPQDCRNKCTTS